ncbi:uncharacterized protein G2W53_015393 [Senna tora]|uniref:Uncharacterized protein n=1 Tax=Senna tora TaxID=362788 RepID=A0A834WUQ2_9FABA|nr:uncharacterized protein G2W53_015393 [Senna tora]
MAISRVSKCHVRSTTTHATSINELSGGLDTPPCP